MDNITHSLTGALAAKIAGQGNRTEVQTPQAQRVLFWLMVLSVNLPDVDVLLNFSNDPFTSIQLHRGITHSLLIAPLLSFLPAIIFYLFSSYKQLKTLWITALVGVYLHIFFDLITSFGTQIFSPISTSRYTLDWMFIIDPLFTVILAVLLYLGKRSSTNKPAFARAGGIFVGSYLVLELLSHGIAYEKVRESAERQHLTVQKISALPQPLSIFRWMGLVQTDQSVEQMFFSAFDTAPSQIISFPQANDRYVRAALGTKEAGLYLHFARHPWIQSIPLHNGHLVEMRDQQFSFDPDLVRAFRWAGRRTPFVLRFYFSSAGGIDSVKFNR